MTIENVFVKLSEPIEMACVQMVLKYMLFIETSIYFCIEYYTK